MTELLNFDFRLWVCLVDNRAYDYSELRRMCNSADVELSIPFTDSHLLIELKGSFFEWLESPDAWKMRWGGDCDGYTVESVFPHAEWIDCPDCGDTVPSDLRGGHGCQYDEF